jgi:hypothetical protein
MSMTFFGGRVDEGNRDEIHWMELHGMKIDYVERTNRRGTKVVEYYFTIPQRCNALQEIDGKFMCGVYETRPQMCRDYDGRMEGPFGVADCLWRNESAGGIQTSSGLVQIRSNP